MSDGLTSPHWYRVAKLKPNLQGHVVMHRHDYRGLIWYLLEDTTTGRSHRFNPAAYQFIGLLDGERTVEDIHQQISDQLEDYAPGQEEIIRLLGQLHAADLLKSDALINTEELFDRQTQRKQTKLKQRFMNPVAQKIPLWDPENFLNRNIARVRWVFTGPVALAWLLVIGYTLLQAALHWPQITQHFTINALLPYNLLLMFLVYPVMKLVHELGHAFSAKLEGGEVHEMGINFLLFMPIPYVDVSTAAHFRSKHKRMLVSAAGILVESFLAALGLLLFLAVEPGLLQDIGFNMFLIGGVSSLFFNGNPLLKYDGYYILADALGIPNLYQRSAQYWRYFFQRYLFGLDQVESPASAPGETFWFITYSIASFVYRLAVLWFIFVLVTDKFFVLGVILAGWLLLIQIVLPLGKSIAFIFSSPSLQQKRARAVSGSVAIVGLLVGLLGFLPIPSYTLAEGVVWHPEEGLIKAQHEGFALSPLVENEQPVAPGTPVLELEDPLLQTEVKVARARIRELESQYRANRAINSFEAGQFREEMKVAQSELDYLLEKQTAMTLTANAQGTLHIPGATDLPGRFVQQGELIGYVLQGAPNTVRMVVTQDNIGLLRQQVKDVRIRFASHPGFQVPAKVIRQAPEATNQLPSAALSTTGGGKMLAQPDNPTRLLTGQKVFIVDLEFDPSGISIPLGTRARVRLDHGGEPVAAQLMRRIRQVFLRQINV
jgi:putative peptide zinc metalloprotease protein